MAGSFKNSNSKSLVQIESNSKFYWKMFKSTDVCTPLSESTLFISSNSRKKFYANGSLNTKNKVYTGGQVLREKFTCVLVTK